MPERAKEVLDDMVFNGVKPLLPTYNALIKAYVAGNWLERALQVLQEMRSTKAWDNYYLAIRQ